jgi:hypothetical protein
MQATMPEKPAEATRTAAMTTAAIAVLVAATFGPVLGHGWLNWDDPVHVTANPLLEPPALRAAVRPWLAPYRGLYIPVSYDVFLLQKVVAAAPAGIPDPRVFHAVSLLLHAAAATLVARIATGLGAGGWPAVGAAGLFALHPLQVESVAWISEQRGLLATVVGLAVIDRELACARAGNGRWWTTAGLAVAVLAKPSAMVVPAILFAIETLLRGAAPRATFLRLLPMGLVAAGAAAGTALLQAGGATAPWTPLWLRPVVAGDAIAWYASKLLVPIGLCIDYGRTPEAVCGSSPAWWAAAAVGVALVTVAMSPWLANVRGPLAIFVLGLAPVLGLVPFSFQGFSTVADRDAALALLGPAVGVALAVVRLPARLQPASVLILLAGLAVGSRGQVATWASEELLYPRAIAVNPASVHARINLAVSRIDRGRPAEAIGLLEEAVRLRPSDRQAHYNLGLAWHRLGRRAAAERQYRTAIALDPGYADAFNNLGIVLAETARPEEAAAAFRTAIAVRPGFGGAIDNLRRLEAVSRR